MERRDQGRELPPKKYIGLFVTRNAETREGEILMTVRVLESHLYGSSNARESLEREVALKPKGLHAKVETVESGNMIFERERPEDSVKRRFVPKSSFGS